MTTSKPFESRQLTSLAGIVAGAGGVPSPSAKAAADRRTAKDSAAPPQPPAVEPTPAELDSQTNPARAAVPAEPEPAPEAAAPQPAPERPAARRPAPAKRPTSPRKRRAPAHPRFDELERKESRFRQDQLDDLAALSKRLQRSKPKGMGGERITDNTLIRVAVDLLLEQGHQLTGYTEKDLLDSAFTNITQGDS